MSDKEQFEKLMEQIESLHKKADAADEENTKRGEKIDTIVRGLYGDPMNQTMGLIERQAQDDLNHSKMLDEIRDMKTNIGHNTKFRKKVVSVTKVSGGVGGISGLVSVIAFFKEIKQFIIQLFSHG